MQVYVMCPFCSKVFDTLEEPHAVLRVDRYVRTAHLRCVPEQPAAPAGRLFIAPADDEVKPNGADITTS